ncbi:hypothetical protein L226DRAFT_574404 [Lentinus tigrinus ALCF2SS1-7]|uniref:Uncharacterized protein n=1 Tax=Lentinus tigrinus ALCF2SS1-6 TaxID=1328759 RepID=A0A5C2S9S5_9APHY|nr:hypothetical protein L227DRAFT_611369 [Lentinus tigrinus ALCF2SS1-6]RPD70967.1 hypothetical protein L226DRAFT_574404 [Lentinus tigrinus ALCF2SS1-7]
MTNPSSIESLCLSPTAIFDSLSVATTDSHYDMRLLLSSLTVVAGVLAVPLFLLMMPSIHFRMYLHYLPLEFDHPHLQASMGSMTDANVAALCILPPFSALAFICPTFNEGPEDTARISLHHLLLQRQVLFKKAVYYTPTPHTISSLLRLGSAANASLLLDDRGQEGEGTIIGDHRALLEVAQTSASAARALYRVIVHVELALCRASFLRDTISIALSLLEQVDATGRYIRRPVPRSVDRATSVFGVAMLDSIGHIRRELRVASTLSTTLLAAVENAQADPSYVSRHCSIPRNLCAEATALIFGENILRAVIQDLSMLKGIFDLELEETSPILGAPDMLLFVVTAIRENEAVLGALLLSVRNARETAALAMKVGHLTA